MNDAHSLAAQANGYLQIAIRRLAGEYPFYARILEQFDPHASTDVGTMGVAVAGDRVRLSYNPEFVLGLSYDELGAVLLHEVHHVLFRHILADPEDYPDEWARTVAEEVTCNEYVRGPLPAGAIMLEMFPQLKPGESTDQRYQKLCRRKRRTPTSSLASQFPSEPSDAEPGASKSGDAKAGGSSPDTLTVIDNHAIWDDDATDESQAAATIKAVVQDAIVGLGEGEVPDYLLPAIRDIGIGHTSGHDKEELNGGNRGNLNWQTLLRRYVGQRLRVRPSFAWPSRRLPHLVGIAPGTRRRAGRPGILAVIDTSASLTSELLGQISGELGRLAADYRVTVVECDDEIQGVYSYRPIHSVEGRGGTDLRPPFEPAFLQRYCPDLIVYFTDGAGPSPEKPPRQPVVWCLTPDGERPAEWGSVVQMCEATGPKEPPPERKKRGTAPKKPAAVPKKRPSVPKKARTGRKSAGPGRNSP